MNIIYKTEIPDCDQYFTLFESTGWNVKYSVSKEGLFTAVKKSYFSVSAYSSGRLIGFGRILSDGILHAMIYEMIVHPEYQTKGIGGRILIMLVKKCLDNDITDIQLFCAKGKRKFYEKHGFAIRSADCPGMEYTGTAKVCV